MSTTGRPSDALCDAASRPPGPSAAPPRLSMLDRLLPLWIALAMAAGLALGSLLPGLDDALDGLRVGTVSLPIAAGLLLMMYPVLAKVRYEELGRLRSRPRLFVLSLVLNWVVGPALMFALAWTFLPDQPEYRTGLIIVGLARCIAMVLVWSDLARADNQATALLVAMNALFQVVAYAALAYLYLSVLPGWLGLDGEAVSVSMWEVARTVLVFLGIPLVAGYLTRRRGIARWGRERYETWFLPRIAPLTLWGLLATIVLLFALQGDAITAAPLDVARIAVPLLLYFAVMFALAFGLGWASRLSYPLTASLSFSAASNDFELAIAVSVGVFGATSGQALAGVVGPLVEVPALLALVYVSLWAGRRVFGAEAVGDGRAGDVTGPPPAPHAA